MKFKQFLLLIASATSLGMILASNKTINSHQNTTLLNKSNVSITNFHKMTGTIGAINSLTFNSEQIYVVNNEGILYKSNNGQSFTKTGLANYKIKLLLTTPNGTIYAGAYEEQTNSIKIYVLNHDQLALKYTLEQHQLLAMTFDKDNNIYIGTNQGVYTNSNSRTDLQKIEGTTDSITVLKTTNNGLIYAGNNKGEIFKSIGGYQFNSVDKLETGITSITVNKAETVFVTNKSKQVYYKTVNNANFLSYKQSLETINTSVITFGQGVLVGDKNGNIWKSYQSQDFSLLNKEKISSIKELIYNSNNFTIYVTTSDGVYKNK